MSFNRRGRPEKSRECDVCGKSFKRHTTMLEHKLDYHAHGLKKIVCPVKDCGYRTNRVGNLNSHLIKKHGAKSAVMGCFSKYCKRKFRSEENLIKHMKKCLCFPRFNTISCHCGKEFVTKEGLDNHKKIFHQKKTSKHIEKVTYSDLMKIEDLFFLK